MTILDSFQISSFVVNMVMIKHFKGKVGGTGPKARATYVYPRRTELKFARAEYENSVVGTVAGAEADPTSGSLSGVSTGTGESNRIGRVIYVKSIYVKGHINISTLSLLGSEGYVRLWMVLDKQTNRAQLSSESVLSDPSSTNLDADAMQNLQFSDRFSIVKTELIKIKPSNTAGNGTTNDSGSIDVPFAMFHSCNVKQEHAGTSSNVTDITTNSFHLIAIKSANLTVSTNLRYRSQMRFTD